MATELIFIILLVVLLFVAMGTALHLTKTIEQLRQYISELERDLRQANEVLQASGLHDKEKGGVTETK